MKEEEKHFKGKEMMIVRPIIGNICNSFTYEFWVKPTAALKLDRETLNGTSGLSGQRYVIGPGHGKTNKNAGAGVSVGTNGISVYEHTSNYLPALLVYPMTIREWTHIAIVYRDKTPYLYINGEFKKKGITSRKKNVYASGLFGGYDPYGFYVGFIRDISIWDYARSIEEINESMRQLSNEKTEKQNGLFGYWRFHGDTIHSSEDSLKSSYKEAKLRHLSILFVKSGLKPGTYWPLEMGILDSLKKTVRKLCIALPNDNLSELARTLKPDLVLVFSGFKLPLSKIDELKRIGVKTAIWMTDDPYYTDVTKKFAPYFDFVFTQEINCLSFYRSLGCRNVYFLPLAVNPNIYRPKIVDAKYQTDILFIGSAFGNRITFFDKVSHYLASKNVLISGLGWDRLSNYQLLKHKIKTTWMNPEEVVNYYNGSKIVINMHRSHDDQTYKANNSYKIQAFSPNPRTFEISACGAFQLTDFRKDLSSFYTPGYDIAVYDSPADLIKNIEYYLTHEEERRMMASRALKKIRNEHTFAHSISKLLDTVFG
ncbi:MAG: glycosyltransferase family protein [Bacillota bacterium]